MELNAEQIKFALVCHADWNSMCEQCPYTQSKACGSQLARDALALIKKLTEELEKERTWADSMIDNLRDDIRELTEEKEAAVKDLKSCMYYANPKRANTCNFCIHDCEVSKDGIRCKGKDEWNYCSPVWRGVVKSKSEGEQ